MLENTEDKMEPYRTLQVRAQRAKWYLYSSSETYPK